MILCAFIKKLALCCTEILIFPSNSAKTLTSFFPEFWKMGIREDNCNTTKLFNYSSSFRSIVRGGLGHRCLTIRIIPVCAKITLERRIDLYDALLIYAGI